MMNMYEQVMADMQNVLVNLVHADVSSLAEDIAVNFPSGDEIDIDNFPKRIKTTIGYHEYCLVVLCLCWYLRKSNNQEKRYQEIKNLMKVVED